MPLATMKIDDVIYPVQTKKGLKWGRSKTNSQAALNGDKGQKVGRLLDGFLILYSCRVKLPHEAITSKLASQKIVDVIEEDLCYFQNLSTVDLSDNRVRLEQLRNLKCLAEVNLQFNSITSIPQLSPKDFASLEVLNLAFNQISQDSIRSLYACTRLKKLDLSSNGLQGIPADIKMLGHLECLNLAGNQMDSLSNSVNPSLTFKALGSLPHLKILNLSRNRFFRLHGDILTPQADFSELQELDISHNQIESDQSLWYLCQCKAINMVVITGNPFATKKSNYEALE